MNVEELVQLQIETLVYQRFDLASAAQPLNKLHQE